MRILLLFAAIFPRLVAGQFLGGQKSGSSQTGNVQQVFGESIFKGSNYQGHALDFAGNQTLAQAIFFGGTKSGFTSDNLAAVSMGEFIFKGSTGTGENLASIFNQTLGESIFKGAFQNGNSSQALNQISLESNVFKGGSGKGEGSLQLLQALFGDFFFRFTVYFYLQGLFDGNNQLISCLHTLDPSIDASISDSVVVCLQNPADLDSLACLKSTVSTSGETNIMVPGKLLHDTVYLSIKHRNSIETWSALPVILDSTSSYSFLSHDSLAYGNNQIQLAPGLYGFFAGDINQDGSIDFLDYPDLDNSALLGELGYLPYDLNGDLSVDFLDYPLIDLNSLNGVISLKP